MRSFLEFWRGLDLDLPSDVDPSPFTRAELDPPLDERRTHRIGAYNVLRKTSREETVEDFVGVCKAVDAVGLSESRGVGKADDVRHALKKAPRGAWTYFQGKRSDTALAWNVDRYDTFYSSTLDITDSLWRRVIRMPVAVPVVGLQDVRTDERFFLLCAHTQVRGYKIPLYAPTMKKQYREINDEITRLNRQGHPVFLVGDLNHPRALSDRIAPPRFQAFAHRLDYIVFDPDRVEKLKSRVIKGIGFNGKREARDGPMNSDHPFIWAAFRFKDRS